MRRKKNKNLILIILIPLLLIGSIFLISALSLTKEETYIYDEDFENLKLTIYKNDIFYKIYSIFIPVQQNIIYLEKNIVEPGESIGGKVSMIAVPCSNVVKYEVCFSPEGWSTTLNCVDLTSIFKQYNCNAWVLFTATAPNDPGEYEICDILTADPALTIPSGWQGRWNVECRDITVEEEPTQCPDGDCYNWRVIKWYSSTTHCKLRECWDYSNPPTCDKYYDYTMKVTCEPTQVVQGYDNYFVTYPVSSGSTDNCLPCIDVSNGDGLPDCEMPCIEDMTVECPDNTIITTGKCVEGCLIETGEECIFYEEFCGDGICFSGENIENCPEDCDSDYVGKDENGKPPFDEEINILPYIIVVGFLIICIVIGIYVYKKRK